MLDFLVKRYCKDQDDELRKKIFILRVDTRAGVILFFDEEPFHLLFGAATEELEENHHWSCIQKN